MVPTTVIELRGRLIVRVITPTTFIDVYYIDRFSGQQTEITLYTENHSAADYNLYDVTLDTSVHGIRGFMCNLNTDFDYVFLEIDGRLYMPYASDDVAETLINWNDDTFEYAGDLEMAGFNTIVPKIAVEFDEEGTVMRVPSFGNIEIGADELIEITGAETAFEAHVDGIIPTEYGIVLGINGIYHIISDDGADCTILSDSLYSSAAWAAYKSGNLGMGTIYDTDFHEIRIEGGELIGGLSIEQAKNSIEEDFGITLADDYIPIAEGAADILGPFVINF